MSIRSTCLIQVSSLSHFPAYLSYQVTIEKYTKISNTKCWTVYFSFRFCWVLLLCILCLCYTHINLEFLYFPAAFIPCIYKMYFSVSSITLYFKIYLHWYYYSYSSILVPVSYGGESPNLSMLWLWRCNYFNDEK